MQKATHKTVDKNLISSSTLLYDLHSYFLQIQTLSSLDELDKEGLNKIITLSKHALSMINFALITIEVGQEELALSNVSASAIVQEVATSLSNLANTYDVNLDVVTTKKMDPIYTNETVSRGILYGLAASMITKARMQSQINDKPLIVITAQETKPKTQRLGVYSPNYNLKPSIIKSTRKAPLKSRSVAPNYFHHSGLGLIISDNLSRYLNSRLQRFEHRGNKGIGFYVPMSSQLSLI